MDLGRYPREGILPSLGLNVSWLLAVMHRQNYMYIIQGQ